MTESLDIAEIGDRVRNLRLKRGFSLQDLSERATVSVSMLSAVERGEKVASIQVLHQIATALNSSIARLVEDESLPRVEVLRRDEQIVMDDRSGWQRRILSPVLPGIEFELMRTTIEPGVDAGEFGPHRPGSREYLAVEQGVLTLILDGIIFQLEAGDSIYYAGDSRHVYRNDGESPCSYYLAMDLGSSSI
ncbi:helix-turn-helix domain-containing protein [Pelagibius sp. Alg239-R121]|uniref:helix-turn-helix domain-containing protein n=1 Tax=Pelagibius sp. Alg239-R121 TaxID=2993448 RepID=UPI0024A6582F|nr:helix-turn-helix domain-containing protein [Pelagibius sp. Alg239-R121]